MTKFLVLLTVIYDFVKACLSLSVMASICFSDLSFFLLHMDNYDHISSNNNNNVYKRGAAEELIQLDSRGYA